MENINSTILSQYSSSPVITTMINEWNIALGLTDNIQLFLQKYWDVSTATGVGLDIWGRIVNVSRYLYVLDSVKYFGFSGNTNAAPFNNAPFYSGKQATKTFALEDNIFRSLILAKAYSNISVGSVKDVNYVLNALFSGYGKAYCQEVGTMGLQIVFNFTLESWQLALILQSGVVPIPAGVSITITDESGIIINDLVIIV